MRILRERSEAKDLSWKIASVTSLDSAVTKNRGGGIPEKSTLGQSHALNPLYLYHLRRPPLHVVHLPRPSLSLSQHLRKELDGALPSEDVAADILSSIQNFQSAAAINAALGRIFAMLAAGRIKRQEALSLAYMCQLMLQSLKGFKHEICLTTYEKIFERDLLRVLNARTPLEEFVFPPSPEEDVPEEAAPEETLAVNCGSPMPGVQSHRNRGFVTFSL
jgi:hypothetical protein